MPTLRTNVHGFCEDVSFSLCPKDACVTDARRSTERAGGRTKQHLQIRGRSLELWPCMHARKNARPGHGQRALTHACSDRPPIDRAEGNAPLVRTCERDRLIQRRSEQIEVWGRAKEDGPIFWRERVATGYWRRWGLRLAAD
jgi:hypothetical protein